MSGVVNTTGADSGVIGTTSQTTGVGDMLSTVTGRVLKTTTNTSGGFVTGPASGGSSSRVFLGLETTVTTIDNNSQWIFNYMCQGGNSSGTNSWGFHIDWKVSGGSYAMVTCEGTDDLVYTYYAQSDPRRNKQVMAVITNITHSAGATLLFKPSCSSQHASNVTYFTPPHVFSITEMKT
jgi:hypothetical protein